MKKLLSVFLSFVVLSHALVNVGLAGYYHLNKEYIATRLCQNKSTPQMHCNGHCYLSKQLKKAEETEKKQAQSLLKEKEEIPAGRHEAILKKRYLICQSFTYPAFMPGLVTCNGVHTLLKPPTT